MRVLFSSRRRVVVVAAITTLASLGLGQAVSNWIRHTSGDVGVNLIWIVVWTAAMMAAAATHSILLGDLLWGERWRRRTLLGWQPAPEEVEPEDVKDRTWMLYGLFIVLIGTNYAVNGALTGNFFGWYRFRGFALVQLRSEEPAQRLEGITELAEQEDPEIVSRLAELLDDPDPEVRAVAIGVMGDRKVEAARARVHAALKGEPPVVRTAAAEALGRLGGEGVRAALEGLLAEDPPVDVRRGALAGLGLLRDRQAGTAVTAQLEAPDTPEEARAVAAWALGELRAEGARERLLAAIAAEGDGVSRCAALHALAKILDGKAPDVPKRLQETFARGRVTETFECPRAFITPRTHLSCFGKVNRPVDGPYEGDCIRYQISSPETFRVKIVRAAARMAGKGSMRFLADAYNDKEEPPAVRSWAGDLFLKLKKQP